MEQKCFLRLFREREGQMSLINTDLLRGLGSGRGRQSSCLSQCTRSPLWDPGWEVRAGPPSMGSGWWVYPQKVQRGAGCCAPTPGCLHPRADLTCTKTAERQGRAPSALSNSLEKFGDFQKKRAEVESFAERLVLGWSSFPAPTSARTALCWAASSWSLAERKGRRLAQI